MTTTTDVAAVARATCDSADYRHTFYGILNKQGQFWTPLPFHDEAAARSHLERYAVGMRSGKAGIPNAKAQQG